MPTVTDIIRDGNGAVVDLTGAAVQFVFQANGTLNTRTALVVDAVNGVVAYTFATGETNTAGAYLAQWIVTAGSAVNVYPIMDPGGVFQATATDVLMKWPDGSWHRISRKTNSGQFLWDVEQQSTQPAGWIEFAVVSAIGVTLLSDVYEPLRAILGDLHPTEHQYPDSGLDMMMRSMVKLGKINQGGAVYTVTPNNRSIQPQIPDGNALALLVYHSAVAILLPNAAAYRFRQRALSESFGEQTRFLFTLENTLFDLVNPNGGFATVQNFYGWVNAQAGLNLYAVMTNMDTRGPIASVTIGRAGLQVDVSA